jgi:hypothetical protein
LPRINRKDNCCQLLVEQDGPTWFFYMGSCQTTFLGLDCHCKHLISNIDCKPNFKLRWINIWS